ISVLHVYAEQKNRDKSPTCPCCGHHMHVHGHSKHTLKDFPVIPRKRLLITFDLLRYFCPNCSHTCTEQIDIKYPNTSITKRAALWIASLLEFRVSISAISKISGIDWAVIKKLNHGHIKKELELHRKLLRGTNYKPTYIAVDEFAIKKGHEYATSIMDIHTGEIYWIGKGRSTAAFEKCFHEIDVDFLSNVKAVAMDMHQPYENVIRKHLPHVEIVFDKFHVLAQYGKDVLGAVRLAKAREHLEQANSLKEELEDFKQQHKDELKKDSSLVTIVDTFKQNIKEHLDLKNIFKSLRWVLLSASAKLTELQKEKLDDILSRHEDLAICYSMREELKLIYDIDNPDVARVMWEQWFTAAKASNIPQLIRFAEQKEKRIDGLVAYAKHPITTAKLEGTNNKIKVLKRIAFGYRDDEYFFDVIKYNSVFDNSSEFLQSSLTLF
ncbi:MAG: ISL3 family transposase, partial [Oscillospiraceae bacterium]|nr:ISL3 family transposase [Oscillospiraceae bacterium]